jgi:peptidylprolyl isomerase/peptidyl-prolyl cis-trans isomerase B (cyclophilin B)
MKRTHKPFGALAILAVLLALTISLPSTLLAQDALTPAEICANALPAVDPENRSFAAAEQVLEADVDYRAVMCADSGPVYIDLLEVYAPLTVNNFVFLAQQGYYNNTTFHRVIPDFMVQGGDPTATGMGDPGYSFEDEFAGFLFFDTPGWLAMANAGPATNGSQFFITTVPTPHLDYQHTIFGEVLEGQENILSLRERDPQTATENGSALETVVIITDPASVETTYATPESATEDDFRAEMEALIAEVPAEILSVDEAGTGVFTTEEAASLAPESVRDEVAAYLAENNHEFRASISINNAACDLQTVPYLNIAYAVDAFASTDDAALALADARAFSALTAELGEPTDVETLEFPIFTQSLTACEIDATRAVTVWQRGRYVITAEATFAADSPAPTDLWLTQATGIVFERIFSDMLRRELR